jgi:hypothetical protein
VGGLRGFDQKPSSSGRGAGPLGHRHQRLIGILGGPEVGPANKAVDVEDAHHRDLGAQLGLGPDPGRDVDVTGFQRPSPRRALEDIGVDAPHCRARKGARQLLGEAFGAGAERAQLCRRAAGAAGRHRSLIVAARTAHSRGGSVVGEPGLAHRAAKGRATGRAPQRAGVTAPGGEKPDLLAPLERGGNAFVEGVGEGALGRWLEKLDDRSHGPAAQRGGLDRAQRRGPVPLQRRCRAHQDAHGPLKLRPLQGHSAGVEPRGAVLLIAGIVLVVDHDEPQTGGRGKHRGTAAGSPAVARRQTQPRLGALPLGPGAVDALQLRPPPRQLLEEQGAVAHLGRRHQGRSGGGGRDQLGDEGAAVLRPGAL